jgi:hypothetical protein
MLRKKILLHVPVSWAENETRGTPPGSAVQTAQPGYQKHFKVLFSVISFYYVTTSLLLVVSNPGHGTISLFIVKFMLRSCEQFEGDGGGVSLKASKYLSIKHFLPI